MAIKFSNNAVTTLSAGISAGVTSFQVASSSGFPTLGGSDWTYVTVDSEVVKITAISGTTFTCIATSSSHSSGDNVELRMTAELLDDFATDTESLPLAGGTMTGDIDFVDNVKANFGAGDDLKIYHDGSHSYISDTGTGVLKIKSGTGFDLQTSTGENYLDAVENGTIRLYYDNSKKLETTSTGIDVTGTVFTDGIRLNDGAERTIAGPTNQTLVVNANPNGAAEGLHLKVNSLNAIDINLGGDISFYEDTGTTPKFYWDASAERLGIGTTAPTEKLHLSASVMGDYVTTTIAEGNQLLIQNTVNDNWSMAGLVFGAKSTTTNYARIGGVNIGNGDTMLTFQTSDNAVYSEVMNLKSGQVNVTGTVTATGSINAGSSSEGVVNAGLLQLRSSNTAAGHFFRWDVEGVTASNKLVGYWNDGAYRDRLSLAGNNGETVVNDSGLDVDFRVESDNSTHALFVQGSDGNVGIGTSSPDFNLEVEESVAASGLGTGTAITIHNSNGAAYGRRAELNFITGTTAATVSASVGVDYDASGRDLVFATNGGTLSEKMRITSAGSVGIGTATPTVASAWNKALHVHSTAGAGSLIRLTDTSSVSGASTDTGLLVGQYSNESYIINRDSGGMRFYTNNAERMRIDSSGNVGIGTTSPLAKLTLKGANDSNMEFQPDLSSGINRITNYNRVTNAYKKIRIDASEQQFYISGNPKVTINSSGNVGIGVVPESWHASWATLQFGDAGVLSGRTDSNGIDFGSNFYYDSVSSRWEYITNDEASRYNQANGTHTFYTAPSGSADAAITWTTAMTIDNSGDIGLGGTTAGYAERLVVQPGNGYSGYCIATHVEGSSTQYHLRFANDNGIIGSIRTNGSTTSFVTSSDYRLKENVDYDWDATTRLKQLKPARFNFISDETNTTVDGFLAHEAQTVVPECVSGLKDAMQDEEYEVTPAVMDGETIVTEAVMGTRSVPDMQGIDQSKLVPLLVKTIQELEARITALEA